VPEYYSYAVFKSSPSMIDFGSFINEVGGGETVSGFLKKYSWAPAVFKDEKRASAEERKRTAAILTAHGRRSAQA
jgi:hypothetical protein